MPKKPLYAAVKYSFLIFMLLLVVIPFAWMIITSFQPTNRLVMSRPFNFPWPPFFRNYALAWNSAPFNIYTFNSIYISTATTLLQLVTALLAGYAFTYINIPGKKFLFLVVLAVLMMPSHVAIIPIYMTMVNLGWLDTYAALIVPFIVDAYGIFLIKQRMSVVPKDYFEAVRLDGAGHVRILFKIIAPLVKPSLIAYGIMAFKWRWNDYFWVLVMSNSQNRRTMPVGLVMMKTVDGLTQMQILMAATVIVIIPIIVIFLLMQKYIKTDLTGGIKE